MKSPCVVAMFSAALASGAVQAAWAQSGSQTGIRNIVLVHGAFAGRSINPQQERMMANRANATTVEVNASLVAQMSHPLEAAKLIEAAAAFANK